MALGCAPCALRILVVSDDRTGEEGRGVMLPGDIRDTLRSEAFSVRDSRSRSHSTTGARRAGGVEEIAAAPAFTGEL